MNSEESVLVSLYKGKPNESYFLNGETSTPIIFIENDTFLAVLALPEHLDISLRIDYYYCEISKQNRIRDYHLTFFQKPKERNTATIIGWCIFLAIVLILYILG